MLSADMENYLKQIARVLKPGGRCLITYFLLNPESAKLMLRRPACSTSNILWATAARSVPEQARGGCGLR